ncbi:hypothetical protein BD769DRAFT_1670068 [Suillus cothurnatus]|nr:hypothetical protein BD769DRAFT_1670068 [Suillus cothurnatus]
MYPLDEQLPSPTNDTIYFPNDDVCVTADFEASSTTLNDQYYDTSRTMGAPSSQLWHDGRLGHNSELGFEQQHRLSATIDNELVLGFYSNLDDQPFLTYHSPRYYHCDLLHAADYDGPSTSRSIPPQLLPYSTSAMSLNQPSHHQPEYQSHIMAPTFDSDGAVCDHFQADLEAGSVYLQMQSHHHHATGLHLAAVTPAFSPASHYSAPGPPSHLYHLPKHLSSFLQGYNQPFLTGGRDALLPPGVEEHARQEEILNADIPSQDASHSWTNVKQHCTTTFHPYQWPPPRKSRLSTRKRRESGLQSQVSDSVPSMAAPPQPVVISAPSVPPPNPSELPYNPKNKQHQRIIRLAEREIIAYVVNDASLSTGPERQAFIQQKLVNVAALVYGEADFGKKWADLNCTTLYMILSGPCRSIMHICKKNAQAVARITTSRAHALAHSRASRLSPHTGPPLVLADLLHGYHLRPPLWPAVSEPDYQKAAVEKCLGDATFPPKFLGGKDENSNFHFLESNVVWDVLVNTVAELKLYRHIKTLKSLFCTSAAAVKCALMELRTGKLVENDFRL